MEENLLETNKVEEDKTEENKVDESAVEESKTEESKTEEKIKYKFCIYCGKSLKNGKPCHCKEARIAAKIASEPENTFCLYCGKTLAVGEKCSCRNPVIPPPVKKPPSETTPIKPLTMTTSCSLCGKTLNFGETCSCVATPTTTPESTMFSPKLKSTMRTPAKTSDAEKTKDNEDGQKFLSKAGDLL